MKKVSLSNWKKLYDFANEVLVLEPWKVYVDFDITGIEDPETGVIIYGVVLGSGKVVYGLNFFVGDSGLKGYLTMGYQIGTQESIIRAQDLIWLHYEKENILPPEEIKTAKTLGYNYKNKLGWPN